MASTNPFDLLLDNENEDVSLLIAAQQKKLASNKPAVPSSPASIPSAAKLPSKPSPPAQAVRESRYNIAQTREATGRGGPGRGRGGRGAETGQISDFENGNYNRYGGGRAGFTPENGDTANPSERERGISGQNRGPFRGGRRSGYVSGSVESGFDSERPQRRVYERRSGTGIGYGMKREGAGRGNWGTVTDEVLAQETGGSVDLDEKVATPAKQDENDGGQGANANKDKNEDVSNVSEKESGDNEMTLEEYEKLREQKRKPLLSIKAEERKVEIDKDFESMQQLSVRKGNDEIFIKLGSDKDSSKLRDNAEREERARKAMSINEFLKPAEGEKYYSPGGRGRGRGRGDYDRGSFRSGNATGGTSASLAALAIEDQRQFPTLRAK